MELTRGDNDNNRVWGGSKRNQAPSYTVTVLQTQLRQIGVYPDKIDGDFGPKTEQAVKIFQWCLKNLTHAVKNNLLVTFTPAASGAISGQCDSTTQAMLADWTKDQFTLAGDLVRISFSDLTNIKVSPEFKHIGEPVVAATEFVISKAAVAMVMLMNSTAKQLNITIRINQSFRLLGSKVPDAVVTPAKKSQHLIGHAIDCNIVDGDHWNTFDDFKQNKQTANAKNFIQAMKQGHFRWGGDFTHVDTPHFDAMLDPNSFNYDAKLFLNQRQFASGSPIEKHIIA